MKNKDLDSAQIERIIDVFDQIIKDLPKVQQRDGYVRLSFICNQIKSITGYAEDYVLEYFLSNFPKPNSLWTKHDSWRGSYNEDRLLEDRPWWDSHEIEQRVLFLKQLQADLVAPSP